MDGREKSLRAGGELIAEARIHVGEDVGEDGELGDMLVELSGLDLVDGVGFGVVPLHVALGDRADAGADDAFAHDGADVGAAATGRDQAGADGLEELADGLHLGEGFVAAAGDAEAKGTLGAAIHLDGDDVILELVFELIAIGEAATGAVFFVGPEDDADGALGAEAEFLEEDEGLQGGDAAARVIVSTSADVPAIKVAGDDDDFVGLLTAAQLADDIGAVSVGESLGFALVVDDDTFATGDEALEEAEAFLGEGSGGDERGVRIDSGGAGVSRVVGGDAGAADQDGFGAELGGARGARAAESARDAVADPGRMEEDDLAFNARAAEFVELFKAAYADDFGGDVAAASHAEAEDFEGGLDGGDDLGGLVAADPMGDLDAGRGDVLEAALDHLLGAPGDGAIEGFAAGEAMADAVAEISEFLHAVLIGDGGGDDLAGDVAVLVFHALGGEEGN